MKFPEVAPVRLNDICPDVRHFEARATAYLDKDRVKNRNANIERIIDEGDDILHGAGVVFGMDAVLKGTYYAELLRPQRSGESGGNVAVARIGGNVLGYQTYSPKPHRQGAFYGYGVVSNLILKAASRTPATDKLRDRGYSLAYIVSGQPNHTVLPGMRVTIENQMCGPVKTASVDLLFPLTELTEEDVEAEDRRLLMLAATDQQREILLDMEAKQYCSNQQEYLEFVKSAEAFLQAMQPEVTVNDESQQKIRDMTARATLGYVTTLIGLQYEGLIPALEGKGVVFIDGCVSAIDELDMGYFLPSSVHVGVRMSQIGSTAAHAIEPNTSAVWVLGVARELSSQRAVTCAVPARNIQLF